MRAGACAPSSASGAALAYSPNVGVARHGVLPVAAPRCGTTVGVGGVRARQRLPHAKQLLLAGRAALRVRALPMQVHIAGAHNCVSFASLVGASFVAAAVQVMQLMLARLHTAAATPARGGGGGGDVEDDEEEDACDELLPGLDELVAALNGGVQADGVDTFLLAHSVDGDDLADCFLDSAAELLPPHTPLHEQLHGLEVAGPLAAAEACVFDVLSAGTGDVLSCCSMTAVY